MKDILHKTFGGLSKEYYFRQLVFGSIFTILILVVSSSANLGYGTMIFAILNTLLYPYSRFVYESVADFVLGDNFIVLPLFIAFIIKYMTMSICWVGAIFIAPIGLIYLYWHHSKN